MSEGQSSRHIAVMRWKICKILHVTDNSFISNRVWHQMEHLLVICAVSEGYGARDEPVKRHIPDAENPSDIIIEVLDRRGLRIVSEHYVGVYAGIEDPSSVPPYRFLQPILLLRSEELQVICNVIEPAVLVG